VALNLTDTCGKTKQIILKVRVSNLKAVAGNDSIAIICPKESIKIGSDPVSSNSYYWTPSKGLSNSKISNPIASPDSMIDRTTARISLFEKTLTMELKI
jgi:hypothetical protein